jgi:hypothetical protein
MRMGCKRRVDERQIRGEEGKSCGNYAYHLTLFVSRTFLAGAHTDLKGARLSWLRRENKVCVQHSLTHARMQTLCSRIMYNEMQAWHW